MDQAHLATLEVKVLIWGIGSGGAHRGGLAAAKQVGGGEPATADRRRGGGHRLGVHGVEVVAVAEEHVGGWCRGGSHGRGRQLAPAQTVYAEVWWLDLRTEACSGSTGGE
jgi:hypothetical protein